MCDQWSGRFLGILIGWDLSVCKSNQLHVDILRFSFTKLGYILWIPLKWSVIFLHSWTSTDYFSNSTSSFVTNCRFSPIIGADALNGARDYRIRVCLLFIQHKSPRTLCLLEAIICSWLKAGIRIQDPKFVFPKSFEMNESQIYMG